MDSSGLKFPAGQPAREKVVADRQRQPFVGVPDEPSAGQEGSGSPRERRHAKIKAGRETVADIPFVVDAGMGAGNESAAEGFGFVEGAAADDPRDTSRSPAPFHGRAVREPPASPVPGAAKEVGANFKPCGFQRDGEVG